MKDATLILILLFSAFGCEEDPAQIETGADHLSAQLHAIATAASAAPKTGRTTTCDSTKFDENRQSIPMYEVESLKAALGGKTNPRSGDWGFLNNVSLDDIGQYKALPENELTMRKINDLKHTLKRHDTVAFLNTSSKRRRRLMTKISLEAKSKGRFR